MSAFRRLDKRPVRARKPCPRPSAAMSARESLWPRLASMCTWLVVLGLSAAACQPTQKPESAAVKKSGPCMVTFRREITGIPGLIFQADAKGANCAKTQLKIAVLGADNKELYSANYASEDFEGLVYYRQVVVKSDIPNGEPEYTTEPVKDEHDVEAALVNWLDDGITTDQLPAWEAGADQPVQSEFPFLVDDNIDQPHYARIRAAALPYFTILQGPESATAFVLEDGKLLEIGQQIVAG